MPADLVKPYLHIKVKEIPLYNGFLVVILTNSKDKLKKHLPNFDKDEIYAHAILAGCKGNWGAYILFNFNFLYSL